MAILRRRPSARALHAPRSSRPILRRARLLGVLGAPLVLLVLAAGPAAAHPFGDPQTLEVSGSGDEVRVTWRIGGIDDLTLLGVSLGLLPEDRVLLDGAVMTDEQDGAVLAAAPAFDDYVLEAIAVNHGDSSCDGTVSDDTDLAESGATVTFTCGGPVGQVEVEARLLTDLHPAYRTLASGPGGQRAVYDGEHERHAWTLGGASAPETTTDADTAAESEVGRSAAVQIGAVIGSGAVLFAGVVGVTTWLRRRASEGA